MSSSEHVTDAEIGQLIILQYELISLVRNGSIPFDELKASLERLTEGFDGIYSITVDYDLSQSELLESADLGQGVRFEVNAEQLMSDETGVREVYSELLPAWRWSTRRWNTGLRPANLSELLAFGARYPEIQRELNILAPSSPHAEGGYTSIPYLTFDNEARERTLEALDIETPQHKGIEPLNWGPLDRVLMIHVSIAN